MTYNPAANGQAEAFNKTMIKILKKLVKKLSENGMKSLVNASMFPHHCAHTHKCHTIFFGIMLRNYFTLRNSITLTLYNISFRDNN